MIGSGASALAARRAVRFDRALHQPRRSWGPIGTRLFMDYAFRGVNLRGVNLRPLPDSFDAEARGMLHRVACSPDFRRTPVDGAEDEP
jgi:hypothetical protein